MSHESDLPPGPPPRPPKPAPPRKAVTRKATARKGRGMSHSEFMGLMVALVLIGGGIAQAQGLTLERLVGIAWDKVSSWGVWDAVQDTRCAFGTCPERAEASAPIAQLPVAAEAKSPAYHRSYFGPDWADLNEDGCDTRQEMLARDLADARRGRDGCTVLSGALERDRYTGKRIDYRVPSGVLQVDHIVALEEAWSSGASKWTKVQRIAFANDPVNLLTTYGPTNQSKGARDAAGWKPPEDQWCWFGTRVIVIKLKYRLTVDPAERAALAQMQGRCA